MMRFMRNKRFASRILCMLLIAAMTFTTIGCGSNDNIDNDPAAAGAQAPAETETLVLGEGQTPFTFIVVDKDGTETHFEIHTDKDTVGDALLEVDLIAGETSAYGLYVKTVNGITADYDSDKTYWAFYENGEYAAAGADSTTIEAGAVYSFKVEK